MGPLKEAGLRGVSEGGWFLWGLGRRRGFVGPLKEAGHCGASDYS